MINKPASEKMRIIHDTKRPMLTDYINELFTDFTELHGDRYFSDDHAILGGVGYFNGTPVTVIGHRKGRTIEQNMDANFGMAHPEGYRKALRLAHQAEKFHRPVINFVDTGGAFCGVGAEERGQGEAIARCLYEFIELKTPVISIVTGEGGSGGALALAVADVCSCSRTPCIRLFRRAAARPFSGRTLSARRRQRTRCISPRRTCTASV